MRTILLTLLFSAAIQAQTLPPIAPTPAGSQPLDPHAGKTSFFFVVAGDNRPAKDSCPITPQFKDVRRAIEKLQPSFVLWDGDIVYGKDTTKIAGEYPSFL